MGCAGCVKHVQNPGTAPEGGHDGGGGGGGGDGGGGCDGGGGGGGDGGGCGGGGCGGCGGCGGGWNVPKWYCQNPTGDFIHFHFLLNLKYLGLFHSILGWPSFYFVSLQKYRFYSSS